MTKLFLYMLLVLLPLSAMAFSQSVGSLQTAETRLRFEAGVHSPRLSSLQNGPEFWENRADETPIRSVEIAGNSLPLVWTFNSSDSHVGDKDITFVYDSSAPRLRLTWEWEVRSDHGPIEHQIRIENRDSREVVLPLQNSFQFDFKILPTDSFDQLYVEKGADTPSNVGTHLVGLPEDYEWEGSSSSYAQPRTGETREIIPFMLVEHGSGVQTGFYVGIEFSGRTRLTLVRQEESLRGDVGLNPEAGQFRTKLKPGEVFETPRIFLGSTHGGPDAAANVVRRWIRDVLANRETWKNPLYPLVINDSWSHGSDVSEEIARHMIRDSADLGFEMFHLDAGWSRSVGDWQPDPAKFPHGLQPVIDEAHGLGLKFGLWTEWAQAAVGTSSGALNVRNSKVRDWLTTDVPANWKPEELKGQTIDIGDPPAKAWAMHETDRIVNDYKLDMLQHDGYLVAQGCDASDHPHLPPDPLNKSKYQYGGYIFAGGSNSTDVSYHATRAYYDIQSNLRRKHPELLLEVTNDGGRMVDFGSAAHGDYFSITNTYDPVSNRRAFYDATYVLPPFMLETPVESWPSDLSTSRMETFLYTLRSGMMGWLDVMVDTTAWNARQREAAKQEIQLYKSQLRPLIREADVYHISDRPDGVRWDAVEYFDPRMRRGVVYAFRGSTKTETLHRFIIRGVDPGAKYQLRFRDHSAKDQIYAGDYLLTSGVLLKLPIVNSSDIILLEEVPESSQSSRH